LRTERVPAWRWLAGLALVALLTLPLSAQAPSPAETTSVGAGDALATRMRDARRACREARVRLDPRAILESERTYAAALEDAAGAFAGTPAGERPTGPAAVFVLLRLLTARDPEALRWLEALSPADAIRFDPGGEVLFWAGVAARDAGRWERARDGFGGAVAPALRENAEWLRVLVVEELDPAAAGESALEILERSPAHRFAGRLGLRAARHLMNAGRGPEALALLVRTLEQPSLEDDLRAGAHTRIAEIHRLTGDAAGFRREFLLAAQTALGSPEEATLRLNQAGKLLDATPPGAPADAAVALRVILKLSRARDALAAYRRGSGRVTPEERRVLVGQVLEALYRARSDDELLRFTDELRAGADRAGRVRGALYAGRVWKRRRDLPRLEEAYRAAASAVDTTHGVGAEERQDAAAALWEMGREREDAEHWEDAARAFAELRRRFPDETNAVDAGVQEALCLDHAGDRAGALERLERVCREAPPSRVAAPCLWRGLLGGDAAPEFFSHASAETNPGYYALRARGAMARGPAERDSTAAAAYWADVTAAVRDAASWSWPSEGNAVTGVQRVWLDRLETDARAAQGELFLAFRHAAWGRELWSSMPGWRELPLLDRAALLRALGDPEGATRAAIEDGGPSARYPIAFSVEIASAAARFSLSPAFLLAVARQESLLDPRARSGAGARGLLQLMPETARRMADSLGWTGFDLERPRDNVWLGAAHLDELLDATGGEVPVALAAYNAGLGRARAWRARARDLDDFQERIGFPETRRFVRSVLMHYGFYRDIYPSPPAAPTPRD